MKSLPRLISFLFLGIFFVSISFGWGSTAADQKAKDKTETPPAKREYTPEEFHKAVLAEVEKVLIKTRQENFIDVSKELLNKEQEFKMREMELAREKEQLSINKREFEKKIKAFETEQQKLLGCLDGQDNLKDKRIDHMVDVVSNMKPDSAAQLLSAQEVDLAVSILGKLDAVKVSKIFNLMDKEISARLQKQYLNMKK